MKKSIAIIGGGSAALMLAAHLDTDKFDVCIYEKNAALGRKFLVAGDGGFNLTHSEENESFINRYTPAEFFKPIISAFNNDALRDWLKKIGIETFIGSSKRVFPVKGVKPIDVLNAILDELKRKNVAIKTNYTWKGFEEMPAGDIFVFALGGSSWKVTGSDGLWAKAFEEKGISANAFQASNCAFEVNWKNDFITSAEGKSLKNIAIRCDTKERKGEVVITKSGLEGGAIYALSPQIRRQLTERGEAKIFIDLKPALTIEQIRDKFTTRGNRSIKKLLIDRLSFDEVQIGLIKEVLDKDDFTDLAVLAEKIKKLPVGIKGAAPLDEAISTVGGIALTEIDAGFELKKLPGHYCIGEMLDWDAPTGGYLLQGCFSMGYFLAQKLNGIKLP